MEANNKEIEERLENLSPIAVAMDRNLLVNPDDWFWLQEMVASQQQEIEKMQKELDRQMQIGYSFEGQVLDQQKEIERYKEMLEQFDLVIKTKKHNMENKGVYVVDVDDLKDAIKNKIKLNYPKFEMDTHPNT